MFTTSYDSNNCGILLYLSQLQRLNNALPSPSPSGTSAEPRSRTALYMHNTGAYPFAGTKPARTPQTQADSSRSHLVIATPDPTSDFSRLFSKRTLQAK